MRNTRISDDIAMAHNGIISMTNYAKDISDTAEFIRTYMPYLIKSTDYWHDPHISNMLDELIGGREAVMTKDGHVELIGKWEEDDGIYYSNSTYKSKKYTYTSSKYDYSGWYSNFLSTNNKSTSNVSEPTEDYYEYDLDLENAIEFAYEMGYDCNAELYGKSACYSCPFNTECWYLG